MGHLAGPRGCGVAAGGVPGGGGLLRSLDRHSRRGWRRKGDPAGPRVVWQHDALGRGRPSGVNATGGRARSPVGLGGAGALGSLLFPELPRLAHVKSRGPRLLRPSEPRPEGEDLELSQALGLSGAVPLLVARDGEEERAPHVFAAFVRAPEALLESARPREPQSERILLGKQAQRHLLGELTRDARALGSERDERDETRGQERGPAGAGQDRDPRSEDGKSREDARDERGGPIRGPAREKEGENGGNEPGQGPGAHGRGCFWK